MVVEEKKKKEDSRSRIDQAKSNYDEKVVKAEGDYDEKKAVINDNKPEYAFQSMFPSDYWDKKRETETERYEKKEKKERRRGQMGALSDAMRLIADNIAVSKGHQVYQNPYAGKVTQSSYNALNNLDDRHAAILSGIDNREASAIQQDNSRSNQIEENQKNRDFQQKNQDLSRIEVEKSRDIAVANGDFAKALQIESMYLTDERSKLSIEKQGADWGKRMEYEKYKYDRMGELEGTKHANDLELAERKSNLQASLAAEKGKRNVDGEYIDIVANTLMKNEDLSRLLFKEDKTDEETTEMMNHLANSKNPQLQAIVNDMKNPEVIEAVIKRIDAINEEKRNPSGSVITPTPLDQKKAEIKTSKASDEISKSMDYNSIPANTPPEEAMIMAESIANNKLKAAIDRGANSREVGQQYVDYMVATDQGDALKSMIKQYVDANIGDGNDKAKKALAKRVIQDIGDALKSGNAVIEQGHLKFVE